jgi:hypothetical protein
MSYESTLLVIVSVDDLVGIARVLYRGSVLNVDFVSEEMEML